MIEREAEEQIKRMSIENKNWHGGQAEPDHLGSG